MSCRRLVQTCVAATPRGRTTGAAAPRPPKPLSIGLDRPRRPNNSQGRSNPVFHRAAPRKAREHNRHFTSSLRTWLAASTSLLPAWGFTSNIPGRMGSWPVPATEVSRRRGRSGKDACRRSSRWSPTGVPSSFHVFRNFEPDGVVFTNLYSKAIFIFVTIVLILVRQALA